jgi:hypothetical protein
MGIKNFSKWLNETYKNAHDIQKIQTFDYVYVDMNNILHCMLSKSENEGELLFNIVKEINKILEYNTPTKCLILATDGIAPMAKILLQKKRRLEYVISQKFEIPELNFMLFTPGSKFLYLFESRLQSNVETWKQKYNIDVKCMFSEDGEAEIKLVNAIIKNYNNNSMSTHCIMSPDADVVVMSTCTGVKNIYVNNFKNIVNIDKLMDYHKEKIYGNANVDLFDVKHDFALISILLGNDYLQKIYFTTVDTLWACYSTYFQQTGKFITEKNDTVLTLNAKNFYNFFTKICCVLKKSGMNRFKIAEYDNNDYENYIDGLLWCINMYKNSCTSNFDFMSMNNDIHAIGMCIHLIDKNCINKSIQKISCAKKCELINDIFATIVMPISQKHLICYKNEYDFNDKNINMLINKIHGLEKCEHCLEMRMHKKTDKVCNKNCEHIMTIDDIQNLAKKMKKIGKKSNIVVVDDFVMPTKVQKKTVKCLF